MGLGNNFIAFESLTDEELLQYCRQGNPEAEETLIRRYGSVIRSLARPYFLTGGDSEDLIQEGMLGLLNAIRRFDHQEDASFKTFAVLCSMQRLSTEASPLFLYGSIPFSMKARCSATGEIYENCKARAILFRLEKRR